MLKEPEFKMGSSLYDVLHPELQDTRTGEEILADMLKRGGLHFKE